MFSTRNFGKAITPINAYHLILSSRKTWKIRSQIAIIEYHHPSVSICKWYNLRHKRTEFHVREEPQRASLRAFLDESQYVHPEFHVFWGRSWAGVKEKREQDSRVDAYVARYLINLSVQEERCARHTRTSVPCMVSCRRYGVLSSEPRQSDANQTSAYTVPVSKVDTINTSYIHHHSLCREG